MNGIEGNLAIAALYYYMKIKPSINDSSLNKMTFLITISFLARSSSLAAWIPLAFFKILEQPEFFIPIFCAGLFVTIPCMMFSILLDSWYYGTFTIPQINFVHVNVVENVSKYFGVDPWFFYLQGFEEEFCTFYWAGIFGLSMLTV